MIQNICSVRCAALLVLLFSFSPAESDDIYKQQQELEKIIKEIDDSRNNLDSLRGVEKQVLKEISNYEQRASMNKTVLQRLNRQLRGLRKDMGISKRRLEESEEHFESSRRRYINNLKYYYSGTRKDIFEFGDEIQEEKDAFRKLIYLRSLAAYDREELTEATEYLNASENEYSSLIDKEKSVDRVRLEKSSEYTIITSQKEKKERTLSKVRRKKESEADRLITLSEEARQMEELIARLEQARLDRERSREPVQFDFKTGNFLSYKGGLSAPMKGNVINHFGWKTERVTGLKSFSPGIEIKGKKNSALVAVASGVVAFIGNLRGYNNFVIVEHEDGFYSTYAGLDGLNVVQNQIVGKGDKIGVSSTGTIKFELRQGREPLDPVEWIRIDSFK